MKKLNVAAQSAHQIIDDYRFTYYKQNDTKNTGKDIHEIRSPEEEQYLS